MLVKKKTIKKSEKKTLRASKANIWANCQGSTDIKTDKYPFSLNERALFGNAVHAGAANVLQGKPVNEGLSNLENVMRQNRQDDFDAYVKEYVDFINKFKQDRQTDEKPIKTIELIEKHAIVEFAGHIIQGTADYIYIQIYKDKINVWIIDLKTGQIIVSALDNLQLFVYANLVIDNYLTEKERKRKEINIQGIIVQPSHNLVQYANIDYDPARFEILYTDYRDKETKGFITGAWCQYCDSYNLCPTLQKQLKKYFKPEYQNIAMDRKELILEILPYAKAIKTLMETVQNDAKNLIVMGETLPGWTIRKKAGHRAWSNNFSVSDIVKSIKTQGHKVKLSDLIEEKIISPAQIEKKFKKIDLSDFVFKPYTDYLVQDDDVFQKKD